MDIGPKASVSLIDNSPDKNLIFRACKNLIDIHDDIYEYQRILLLLRAIKAD